MIYVLDIIIVAKLDLSPYLIMKIVKKKSSETDICKKAMLPSYVVTNAPGINDM